MLPSTKYRPCVVTDVFGQITDTLVGVLSVACLLTTILDSCSSAEQTHRHTQTNVQKVNIRVSVRATSCRHTDSCTIPSRGQQCKTCVYDAVLVSNEGL
jgi:hypothetical protein